MRLISEFLGLELSTTSMHNLLQTGHTKLELETSQIDLNQEFLPRGTIIGEHTSNRKGTTMTDSTKQNTANFLFNDLN